ncbi:MAG: ornithine cyclodeaminase family protein [Candidatus Thorarchaeota archaeon]|jgi:ornithine cyclodeaminase/alanine dehydrogenase
MRKGKLLYLSQADVVETGITMSEIISQLEIAFKEKGEGNIEMPPKPGIHPGGGDNFIHAMPAYIPALDAAGMKWVSGFPDNQKNGLPYITGLLILNDPQTGIPIAVMDCVWITAMRTGAATAVAAKFLARSDSSSIGVLGCGVQGRSNVEALNALFNLKTVNAYDIKRSNANSYRKEIEKQFGLDVRIVDDPEHAVKSCDIVITAGPILKIPHATIQAGWLNEGSFASLVDFDSYWHPAAMAEADKYCTDDIAQLRHYQEIGYFKDIPDIYADLGELTIGKKPGRESDKERTMTVNLGLGMDDMAVAPLIYNGAIKKGIGKWLPL